MSTIVEKIGQIESSEGCCDSYFEASEEEDDDEELEEKRTVDSDEEIEEDESYGSNEERTVNSDEEFDEDDSSDGSNTEALIQHIEDKFRTILDEKITKCEAFFDNHQFAINTIPEVDVLKEVSKKPFHKLNQSNVNVLTQTDDASYSELLASMQPTEEPEIARSEISNLRDARMSLVNQRKELSDKIKQASSEDPLKKEERRLYEYEEAIEAIDTAIEYKNEIILGQKCILSNLSAPGNNEADLVTRLTSLSIPDLQRLLCKYFSKVVELRFSSRKLEKTLEKLETEYEKLSRRVAMDHQFLKQKDAEHESRIKHLLRVCNKDPNSPMGYYIQGLVKNLATAEKKQYDLERSLTELLVRHGYLLNGADYDVKQVVRMLGIDTMQMGLNWKYVTMKEEGRRKEKSGHTSGGSGLLPAKLVSALESGSSGQGMSRRMKEQFSKRRNAQASSSHHPPPPLHVDHSQRKSHYHHHHHSSRPVEPPSDPFPGTEVRRQKKKLIIQPSHPTSSSHHHYNHH